MRESDVADALHANQAEAGHGPRVREWGRELNARMDEVLATLEDEGVNR